MSYPGFLKDFVETRDPDEIFGNYMVPEECNLDLIHDGLASGYITWNDGDVYKTVIYDSRKWGHIADRIAPRSRDNAEKLDFFDDVGFGFCDEDVGIINGYNHHTLENNLGWFFTTENTDPIEIAKLFLYTRLIDTFSLLRKI